MSVSKHPLIRRLLHQYHDGLTSTEVSERLELKPDTVRNALKDMPDTYIDRWTPVSNEPPHAVWCAVVPPEDCPRPKKKVKKVKP
jgi:hypothetical protein